jgi:hypothetical protein
LNLEHVREFFKRFQAQKSDNQENEVNFVRVRKVEGKVAKSPVGLSAT